MKRAKIKTFDVINTIIMSIILIVTLYPFYYVVIASLSEGSEVIRGNVVLLPKAFTLKAYEKNSFHTVFFYILWEYNIFYSLWRSDQYDCHEYGGICIIPEKASGETAD